MAPQMNLERPKGPDEELSSNPVSISSGGCRKRSAAGDASSSLLLLMALATAQ